MAKAPKTADNGLGRRSFLFAIGGGAVALSVPGAGALAAEGESTLTRFLEVSRLLTRRRALDAVIGRRIYEELNRLVPRFDYRIDAMRRIIDAKGISDVEALVVDLAAEDRDLSGLLRTILAAWYTGVVGDGENAHLIAYDKALMFDTVRDAVVVPSYCRAAPGYWTASPPAV